MVDVGGDRDSHGHCRGFVLWRHAGDHDGHDDGHGRHSSL